MTQGYNAAEAYRVASELVDARIGVSPEERDEAIQRLVRIMRGDYLPEVDFPPLSPSRSSQLPSRPDLNTPRRVVDVIDLEAIYTLPE